MPANDRGARILVVDDEEAIRELLKTLLTGAGYDVVTAANGRGALNLLAETSVDLVITDLVMPEQEGIETIQVLRRDFPGLRVIAVSGAFGGEYLRVARILGAHSSLQKPFDRATLLETVRVALESS